MSRFSVIALALLGFVISWLLVPRIRRLPCHESRRQLHHAHPNRYTHISRFGGLALAVTFLLTGLIALWCDPSPHEGLGERYVILWAALAMFGLGFIDDIRPLGAKRKLLAQMVIASAVYFGGIQIAHFQEPITGAGFDLGLLGYPVTVFWLVAFANLINLVDGVDGLAAGISLMLMGLLLCVGYGSSHVFSVVSTAGLCGALLGFLIYNFAPAQIYLGDGGAYFLGFLAGILSLVHSQKGTVAAALLAPLFVLALPIVDVLLAILRRGIKGLPLFRPDRRHLHHRLADSGLSRTRIVLGFYSCTLLFLALALGVFISKGRWLPMLFGIGCATLLISARSFPFSREWFAVGKTVGNSLEMRKQVRYALSLSHWLELEAERSSSAEDLWVEFGFTLRKLGFGAVTLNTPELRKHCHWVVSPANDHRHPPQRRCRDLGEDCSIEFSAASHFEERPFAFELMTDLAAESWVKACDRWEQVHQQPLTFKHPPAPALDIKNAEGRPPAII